METTKKRILAIVIIAVIGVGIGVGAWYFLFAPGAGTYDWTAEDCPGLAADADITVDQIIRVGVIGDTERIQGKGSLNGATLAAMEINSAGGIDIDGTTYYIGITSENSDEANPILDTAVAVSAAKKLINFKKVQFATGGFRTEAGLAYQKLWMDAKVIFWNTGAATTSLTAKVLSEYDTYKYFFQPSPQNTTALAMELIGLIISSAKLQTVMGGHNVTRFSFMREDLAWTAYFAGLMKAALESNPSFNMTFAGADIAFPQDVTPVQMAAHWTKIQGNNTQIVIPIISGSAGLTFATSYLAAKPNCIPIGINVLAQDANFWVDSAGGANYGVTLESVFETNKTHLTLPFWYNYIGNFTDSPIYTATGSYDAIHQLAWALEGAQSFDVDTLVTKLETITYANQLAGAGGMGAYDSSHCAVYKWPSGIGLAIQWVNGSKHLIPAVGIYPSNPWSLAAMTPPYGTLLNMSALALPHWGLYYYD